MDKNSKKYTGTDIQVLSDQEHVRIRTSIYMGSMHSTTYEIPVFGDEFQIKTVEFIPAVLKTVGEIVDNSIDEFSNVYSKRHHLIVKAEPNSGEYTVIDNGRGIPIDMHKTGRYSPEVALASLRAGRNFGDDKNIGVIGQNGVGSSCVNFLSTEFEVIINRDNKKYHQIFENGCKIINDPIIAKSDEKAGTQITFKLDQSIFSDVKLPEDLIREKCRAVAFTNPYIKVNYNNQSFKFRKGLEDVVLNMMTSDSTFNRFEYKKNNVTIEFFVINGLISGEDEKIFTWLNSSMLFEGGICNTQFLNSFYTKIISYLEKDAKKQKCKVTKNDIRENLLILGNIKISDPEFDSQSKVRLVGPSLKKEMDLMLDEAWNTFSRKNKKWFEEILERAYNRHHTQINKKAIDDHKKSAKHRVDGLIEANDRDRTKCMLFISEGLSAASEIQNVRDPKIHASFPLTGKINNVYGSTAAELLKMGKITNMLHAIGLIPGYIASLANIRYGKIIISTDADPDGADIFVLLINIFYQFWPELFTENKPIIYRLNAPNIVAVKGKKRIHFATLNDYEKVKDKYSGYEINYFKGLGSMITEDWKILLSNLNNHCIPVTEDGNIKNILTLLFSDDTEKRKQWLT